MPEYAVVGKGITRMMPMYASPGKRFLAMVANSRPPTWEGVAQPARTRADDSPRHHKAESLPGVKAVVTAKDAPEALAGA